MSEPDAPMSGAGQPTTAPIRVLLVDDQHLVRSGFRLILSVEDDLVIVGEAADGAAAVRIAAELRPDIVLMDVQMPVMDGIEATREIVAAGAAKVVILTTFDRDDYVFAGLRAGASGFLLKNADPDHLIEAVRAVAHGHALLAPEVTRRVIEQMTATGTVPGPTAEMASGSLTGAETGLVTRPTAVAARDDVPPEGTSGAEPAHVVPEPPSDPRLSQLTPREREVLALVGRGLSNAEIAESLFLGEATVKTHLSNVLAKLHLRDRVRAVVFAYEVGLIHPGAEPSTPPSG